MALYQLAHFAGREDLSLYRMSRDFPCETGGGDAMAAIVEKARKTSVVIINEDHGAPLHRHFIGELLTALRPLGYSVYAAEAFSNSAEGHGEALMSDGYYTQEPMFGRTLRLAATLGFERVEYERRDFGPLRTPSNDNAEIIRRAEERERAQAARLMEAVFSARPNARVIIHVGGSHMLERPVPEQMNMRWMAGFLKEATGIDPLTIDQTACRAPGAASIAAWARSGSQGPQSARSQGVDLFVGHPKVEYVNGRPDWRRSRGDTEVSIPEIFVSATETVIVEARGSTDAGTVPVDRILVRPGERPPLLLPPGQWLVEGFTAAGSLGAPVMVAVDA